MAKKATWKDVSSYSRSDKDRTPRSWELVFGGFRLVVTRWHYGDRDTWYWTCEPFGEHMPLQSKDIQLAKTEAELVIHEKLEKSLDAMP